MSEIIGYMLTCSTYGTWLQGNKRGYVKNGKILSQNKGLEKANREKQKSESVILTAREKQIIRQVILTEADRIGHSIEALGVCTNHIHLVARPHPESIEKIAGRYKSLTTRALWGNGRTGRIWTKGFDKRFCFSEEELSQRIQYVNNHND
jgi:REP element-mobilizing transposase RayT